MKNVDFNQPLQRELEHILYERQRLIFAIFFKLRKYSNDYEITLFDVLTEEELKELARNGILTYQHTEFGNYYKQVWVALEEVRKLLPSL